MLARLSALLCLCLLASLPAGAQNRAPAHPPGQPQAAPSAQPQKLGTFDDWTAARYQEEGRPVCYALTKAQKSAPAMPGRGDVWLMVTQRSGAPLSIAIAAGYAYPTNNADVTLTVELTALNFMTNKAHAFAKDPAAAVALLQRGRQAISRGPSPRNIPVEDTFSLRGFTQAYTTIARVCPPAR